jgi:hypothetical protein
VELYECSAQKVKDLSPGYDYGKLSHFLVSNAPLIWTFSSSFTTSEHRA